MKTHPDMLIKRIREQASYTHGITPQHLLLEELLDMQRVYMVALETFTKESRNEDRNSRGVADRP